MVGRIFHCSHCRNSTVQPIGRREGDLANRDVVVDESAESALTTQILPLKGSTLNTTLTLYYCIRLDPRNVNNAARRVSGSTTVLGTVWPDHNVRVCRMQNKHFREALFLRPNGPTTGVPGYCFSTIQTICQGPQACLCNPASKPNTSCSAIMHLCPSCSATLYISALY